MSLSGRGFLDMILLLSDVLGLEKIPIASQVMTSSLF